VSANRLQPAALTTFTGGLNLRRSQFQLEPSESPDLLNVDVDPRGGFVTRRGWRRWNDTDIVDVSDPQIDFIPRNAFSHVRTGGQIIYVTYNNNLYRSDQSRVFSQVLTGTCMADPHLADFAVWGDQFYVVQGYTNAPVRFEANLGMTQLTTTPFSEVDAPISNVMPAAQHIRGHAGYMFVGNTFEGGANHPNRIRWSHPNRPDAWRQDDFLDIEIGGGKITGMLSFRDHLLIFKNNSLWALYGYDDSSWQLIKVSAWIGAPTPTAITASETAVYFYSANDIGGIYGYTGEAPTYLSEALQPAFEEITAFDNVFVSWAGRRLWVSVPWIKQTVLERLPVGTSPARSLLTRTSGQSTLWPQTLFVADPDVGKGAWTMYLSVYGAVAPVIDGSDVDASFPLGMMWSGSMAIAITLDAIEEGYDDLLNTVDHEDFDSFYRTPWMNMNQPDTKKSWKRPRLICPRVPRSTSVIIETYHDYDETFARRTRSITIPSLGQSYWTETGFADAANSGFDWTEGGAADPSGHGADWGTEHEGSVMIRGGPMGIASAVQMRFSKSPATPRQKWGVDAVVIKPIGRRERT
jgi:hypothetical protein